MKWSESHSVVSNSLRTHGLYSPLDSLGQNTGVGSLSLLQGIFPTQGLNPSLPHCRWILYQVLRNTFFFFFGAHRKLWCNHSSPSERSRLPTMNLIKEGFYHNRSQTQWALSVSLIDVRTVWITKPSNRDTAWPRRKLKFERQWDVDSDSDSGFRAHGSPIQKLRV